MSKQKSQSDPLTRRKMDDSAPTTENISKSLMIKATRGDEISITDVVEHIEPQFEIPEQLEMVRRTDTYYGPKLEAKSDDASYLITAPGPNVQLLLWKAVTDDEGYLIKWDQIGEIKADFTDEIPQYDICQKCGEPIKNVEHERLAAFDSCSGLDP